MPGRPARSGERQAQGVVLQHHLQDPLVRQLYDWGTENPAPQFENFIPFDIWFNGFNTAQVQMITGEITTPEDAATFTQDVADKWRQANRLLLERYKQWAAQKAEADG